MPSDMSTNHLLRRGARYYIRRRVPADLQKHFGGKNEIVRALGTSDRREAERLVREQSVLLDREFDKLRAAPTANAGSSLATAPAEMWDAAAEADTPLDQQEAEHDKHEKRYARFRAYMARLQSEEQPVVTPQHVVATTPAPSPKQRNAAPGSSSEGHLSALVEAWAAERKPERDSVQVADRVVMRFYEHVGRVPVRDITRAHVVQFKSALMGAGQSAPNINKQLAMLRALLQFAVANLRADHNAAQGIKVADRRNAKDKRLPFDSPALQAIFSGPVYSDSRYPQPYGAASFWLPLLALFTGARLEELGQLSPDDVHEESYRTIEGDEHTVWVMRLTSQGEGQGVKNAGSNRRIPVHAELIRLGFIDYAQGQRGKPRIFDGLKADRNGREAAKWSRWFSKYLRTVCGVTDSRMVFHSFRHNFKDLTRGAHVPEEVSDAITGHTSGKVSRRWYGGLAYPLAPMVDAMKRIRVAGLELPAPKQ
ncbi:DUF6538 domain-containing protein [Cupriavidus necator]